MCTTVNADCVLANALASGRTSLSLRELNSIRTELQQCFSDVYFNLSLDSILWAVTERPDMFGWQDDEVKRAEKSDARFRPEYVDSYFNWRIPARIRGRFVSTCRR